MPTLRTPIFLLALVLGGCAADAPTAPVKPALDDAIVFPSLIAVPNGFGADGIAFGPGTTFYVGSLANGAIWRGDAVSGTGGLLVNPPAGRSACGVAYDPRTNRLYVAGAGTGQAYVYDATTGATLAVYQLSDPSSGDTDIQSVTVMGNAVYFTDVLQPVLYRMPLGTNGALPPQSAVQTLPYSGDFQFVPGQLNTSGIVGTPDGQWLLVVNVTTGALYRVNPTTAQTTAINLGSGSLPFGDGIALVGQKLYVVEVVQSQVAVVDLSADFASGTIETQPLTSTSLDFPGHIAVFGSSLYVVNAHLELDIAPDVAYQVVQVGR